MVQSTQKKCQLLLLLLLMPAGDAPAAAPTPSCCACRSARTSTPATGARKLSGSPHAPCFMRLPIMSTRALRYLRHSSAVSVMQGLPSYSW